MEYFTSTIGGQAQKATINKTRDTANVMQVYLDAMEDSTGADAIARLGARYRPYLRELLSIAHIIMDVKGFDFAHALRATIWQVKHYIAYSNTGSMADAIERTSQWAFARCNSNFDYTRIGGRNSARMRVKRCEQISDDTEITVQDDFIYSAMLRDTVRQLRRRMDEKTRARITRMIDSTRGAGTDNPVFDMYTGDINADMYDAKMRKFASRFAETARILLGLDAKPEPVAMLKACFLYWNE